MAIEFKRYLHRVADAGSWLLFKFQSGTHGLNEELGRHRGREGKKNVSCVPRADECECQSCVVGVLRYSSSRIDFILRLQKKLGNGLTL